MRIKIISSASIGTGAVCISFIPLISICQILESVAMLSLPEVSFRKFRSFSDSEASLTNPGSSSVLVKAWVRLIRSPITAAGLAPFLYISCNLPSSACMSPPTI